MAKALIDSMTHPWDATRYGDDYRDAMLKLIDEKIAAGGKEVEFKAAKSKPATNVIDLVSVLQKSLDEAAAGSPPAAKAGGKKAKVTAAIKETAAVAKKTTRKKAA